MKTLLKLLIIALFATGSALTTNVAKAQQVSASVSFSVFHDNLRSHGRWINHSRYGQVWTPSISGFRPYSTGGHWAYTDYGWTWVSDYDWGWAPFHYGRWEYDPAYGWVWIPGYEWGPAWVSWRTGGDYYGWAPLGSNVSVGIGVSFGNTIPYDRWVFTPRRYITSPYVSRYYVPRTNNVTIIRNTTIINNTREANFSNHRVVVVGGPRREDVERTAHVKVQVMHVSNSTRPGRETVDKSKNTVNIYRPVINKTTVDKTVVNKKIIDKSTTNNTTVNKNSNNTTVNKNSNNNTVNKNTEVNKNTTNTVNKNSNNKTVKKNTQEKKKPGTNNNNNNTKPAPAKKPAPKPNDNNKPADNNKPSDNTKPDANISNDNSQPTNDNPNNDVDKKPQTESKVKDLRQNNNDVNKDQVQKARERAYARKNQNNAVKPNNHPNPKNRRPQ